MKNSGYKLVAKPITDGVWGYRISQIRLRQIRTRLILQYGSILNQTHEEKASAEEKHLSIDMDDRKYFEIYFYEPFDPATLSFKTSPTSFKA